MDDADYGPVMLSEVSRRAWAVEQAVRVIATGKDVIGPDGLVLGIPQIADKFLAYLETPFRAADAKLLQAARAYDGRQEAGPLIGALADALERIGRGG